MAIIVSELLLTGIGYPYILYMESKVLIHSIIAVSMITLILVTMASVGHRVDAASAVTTTKSAR